MKKLAVLLGALFSVHCSAQYFFMVYPTTYDRTCRDVVQVSDGYILAGSTNNSNPVDCDVYLMKTDNNGQPVWTKTYGGSKPDYPYSIVATGDGNYLTVGFSQSMGGGDFDAYIIKFDGSGNLIWQKNYFGSGYDEARQIIKAADGSYIVVGHSSSNQGSQQLFMMKMDGDGNSQWVKYYGGNDKEFGNGVSQCSDGGYVITGQTYSWGNGGNVYLIRTNSTGDTLWTRHFGSDLSNEGISIVNNSDDSHTFVVRDSTANRDVDVYVYKFDDQGNELWHKIYGSTEKDTPKSIRPTSDGGYIVGAISRSFGWINPDMWLLKLNSSGDTTWSRHYGQSDHEHCYMAKEDNSGGLIAVGHTRSSYNQGPNQKIAFLKLYSTGLLGVMNTGPLASMDFYPNPSTDGWINIHPGEVNSFDYDIINMNGAVVKNETVKVAEGTVPVNVEGLQPGVYMLRVHLEGNSITKKIVIE